MMMSIHPRKLAAGDRRDPSFASRLLKVANSAGYGLSTKVASVQRAIVVLGVDEVRELALSLAAFAAAGSKRPIRRRFHRNQLWNHSKLVGLMCETLALHELGLGRGHYIAGSFA
jgi:HD-like signal output (HDOD) protein